MESSTAGNASANRWIHESFSNRGPPALLSDDEFDSSSAEESEEDEDEDEEEDEGVWEQVMNSLSGSIRNETGSADKKAAAPPAAPAAVNLPVIEVPPISSLPEVQMRNIKSYYSALLDAYAPSILDYIAKKCTEFTLQSRDEVEVAVAVFYDKAVSDVSHPTHIARLCKAMECHRIHGIILFRETMLSTCQKRFLQLKGEIMVMEETSAALFTDSTELQFELEDPEKYARYLSWTKLSEKVQIHMKFYGELYNQGELPTKVMISRISKMLECKGRHLDLLTIEGVCELWTTIGAKLEIESSTPVLQQHLQANVETFTALSLDTSYPTRVRDKVSTVLRLMKNGWMSPSKSKQPVIKKTTDKKESKENKAPAKGNILKKEDRELEAAMEKFCKGPAKEPVKVPAKEPVKVPAKEPVKVPVQLEKKEKQLPKQLPKKTVDPPVTAASSSKSASSSGEKVATRKPLIQTPDPNKVQSAMEQRMQGQIADLLSKAWMSITDGKTKEALEGYSQCLVLFDLLPCSHPQRDATLLCMYTLLIRNTDNAAANKIYDAICKANPSNVPYLEYVHFKHAYMTGADFVKTLGYFVKLNKVLVENWSSICYPLSKRTLEESEIGVVEREVREFVDRCRVSNKGMFQECVLPNCSTPTLNIVEYPDFNNTEMYNVLECTEKCKQYYHHKCFKTLAKWNIDERCLTPDCEATICRMYEDGMVKRESKLSTNVKKSREPRLSQSSNKTKRKQQIKKQRERNDTNNSQKDVEPVTVSPSPPPSPAPPTPPPPPPPANTAPEVLPTGDDVIDMYGTMLIYMDEYPGQHLTNVAMQMNSIYPWVKIVLLQEILEQGVESIELTRDGTVSVREGSEEEKEERRLADLALLIGHFKNTPISSLKMAIDSSAKEEEEGKTRKKEEEEERTRKNSEKKSSGPGAAEKKMTSDQRQYKRNTKTSAAATAKNEARTNSTSSNTSSPALNPAAAIFSPPISKSVRVPEYDGYNPYSPLQPLPGTHHIPNQVANYPTLAAQSLPTQRTLGSFFPKTTPEIGAPILRQDSPAASSSRTKEELSVKELEKELAAQKEQYEKEIEEYKSKLLAQLDNSTRIQAKCKQYKQDCKIAQEALEDQGKLQENYDKLIKQVEDERRTFLAERTNKSVDSKKLIVSIRIELEEEKKRNDDLTSQLSKRERENSDLVDANERLEKEILRTKDFSLSLRSELFDTGQKLRLTQQNFITEKFNSAHLKLRIAYANCEAQIRERAQQAQPEEYRLSAWRLCQEEIRRKIDDNRFRYDEYVATMRSGAQVPDQISFEEEPPCPPMETGVAVLPLQRYDDILLGREAPPLPAPRRPKAIELDDELSVLESLMSESTSHHPAAPSFMELPDQGFMDQQQPTQSFMDHSSHSSNHLDQLPPPNLVLNHNNTAAGTSFDMMSSFFAASTPAVQPSESHFQFADERETSGPTMTRPPTANVSPTSGPTATRPPSGGSGTTATRPPSAGGSRPPSAGGSCPSSNAPHFLIDDSPAVPVATETRVPGATRPISPPEQVPRSRGRGRARSRNTTPGAPPTAPAPSMPPPGVPSMPPPGVPSVASRGPDKGRALKNNIKEKYSFLSDKEISRYLSRVREENKGRTKVTPAFVIDRVSELVSLDYPNTNTSSPLVSPVPENTCVICQEALNSRLVSELGCGHSFHKNCVDAWFATQNHTCPTCRSHQPPVDMFPPLS